MQNRAKNRFKTNEYHACANLSFAVLLHVLDQSSMHFEIAVIAGTDAVIAAGIAAATAAGIVGIAAETSGAARLARRLHSVK